jgi:hypothetical protein
MKGEYMKEFKEDKKNLEMEIREKIKEFNEKYGVIVDRIEIDYSLNYPNKILSVKLDIEL